MASLTVIGTLVIMKLTLATLLRLAVVAFCCRYAVAAPARIVTLDGDMGCDTLEIQQARWSSLKVAVQSSLARQQGRATPELLQAEQAAIARFTELSRQSCRKLAGPFNVIERRAYSGVSIVRVGFGRSSLWVLQSNDPLPIR
jgi:hypothetical protein